MSWAKLDDRFWSNRKVRKAWKQSRASIGLHCMALTYCAMHETDGKVDLDFVEMMLPAAKERNAAVDALIDAEVWKLVSPYGFVIHDYLEYNESREDATARRARDAARKARGRATGQSADSTGSPEGVRAESAGSHTTSRARPRGRVPDPTRPIEGGERAREPGLAGVVDEVLSILSQCEHLFRQRVAVENAIAMYPNADPIRAARAVVTWASDPAFKSTNGAKLLGDALSKQKPTVNGAGRTKPERQRDDLAALERLTTGGTDAR